MQNFAPIDMARARPPVPVNNISTGEGPVPLKINSLIIMATKEFPLVPETVPPVKTKHHTVQTPIPVPAIDPAA